MKLEVLGPDGQLVDTLPTAKRRGLSRVTWSMRMPPPRVPTAASAAGGAFIGPRLLPGTYTVKLTKDQEVYETRLDVVADARSTHTAADRKAQFDLALRLYTLLGEMTDVVDRMNAVRVGLDTRAARLPTTDALAGQAARRLGRRRRTEEEDCRDQGRRDDYRRGTPARVPGGTVRERRRLRGAPVRRAGAAHRRARARARRT